MDPSYCPLCGAHPIEQGEGEATDAELVEQYESIVELYVRAVKLKAKSIGEYGELARQLHQRLRYEEPRDKGVAGA